MFPGGDAVLVLFVCDIVQMVAHLDVVVQLLSRQILVVELRIGFNCVILPFHLKLSLSLDSVTWPVVAQVLFERQRTFVHQRPLLQRRVPDQVGLARLDCRECRLTLAGVESPVSVFVVKVADFEVFLTNRAITV